MSLGVSALRCRKGFFFFFFFGSIQLLFLLLSGVLIVGT
jgi:hypothetical protein